MSQNSSDLWPADFGTPNVRLPVVILREQAALLGRKTGNLVEAEVRTNPGAVSPKDLEYRFFLVAPALDHYRYYLFMIVHSVGDTYPVRFYPKESEGEFDEIHSEQELVNRLAEVFNSDDTKRVIQSLIAQSQAA